MVDPVTGHMVVFNGEIYNFGDLRQRLVAEGQTFDSTGDTAVMLRALGLHGPEAVSWLRGMFAFACWDPKQRRLLLARDPLGIKPLYIARSSDPDAGWSVAFASELRALLASGLLGTPRLDPQAVASGVWNGFVVGPGTAVKGIDLLWPGRLIELDGAGKEVRQEDFWRIPDRAPDPTMDEDGLAAMLQEGLRLHLASDVPLAVFLSGGVDSSAMANLAQRAAQSPIHTFTLAFEEQELNEGPIARRIAAAIGTRASRGGADGGALRREPGGGAGQPGPADLRRPERLLLVARHPRRRVHRGAVGHRRRRALRRLHVLPRPAGAAAVVAAYRVGAARACRWPRPTGDLAAAPLQREHAAADALGQAPRHGATRRGPSGAVSARLRALSADSSASCWRRTSPRRLPTDCPGHAPADKRETRARTPLSAISVMEQRLFLGERLLRDNDVASMASSLEQRVPLVDQVLFESVDRLPDQARYQPLGRKAMLRRIGLRGLDPALFERPKSGFVLPFDRWIRRGLKDAMDQTLRDPQAIAPAGLDPAAVERLWRAFLDGAPGMYWSRVWSVYVFIRWCHRNRVFR